LSKLPRLSGRELIKRLGEAGFLPQRTEGDHEFLRHPDGRAVTVPLDSEIGPGLMSDIMNELKISRQDFLMLLSDPKRYRKTHSIK
jgi:predicted RNA binding protein YcfA (HicA-like mRNA interferase family)